jgi:hypothetical protein
LSDLLDTLWAGHTGFGELRLIKNGVVNQSWIPLPIDDMYLLDDEVLNRDVDGWDVYFGVLPRVSMEGKTANVVNETSVLWADFDAKVYPGGAKAQAFYALGKVTPAPHIIVDSGHGYHAYWLLASPISFTWAARIMKGIAMATGADRVYDQARILRVPGTHNHKDADPSLVRVLRFDILSPRYASEDFSDYTFRVDREEEANEFRQEKKREARAAEGGGRKDWSDLPGWLVKLITSGRDTAPDGQVIHDRSVLCFKVCARLIEAGWSDEEIEDVFLSYPEGIGEKMAEKGVRGKRWLETTLEAAHRSTGL